MPQGTLSNLANSAFVRTPPAFAERIVRSLLSFPGEKATNILDPTAGEGDLLIPCLDIPYVRLYGVEISAERTNVARTRLPQAELVSCAFEGVSIPTGSMSLVLANPPYFFQDGKRAEYRIIADAGMLLMPGGVVVAIIPAESRRLQGYRYHTPSVSVPGRSLSRVQAGGNRERHHRNYQRYQSRTRILCQKAASFRRS